MNYKLNKLSTLFLGSAIAASTAFGGRVFTLDQQGSLIVLSADLSKSKIYDLGEVETPAFIAGTKLYKDGEIIELSKLGYE